MFPGAFSKKEWRKVTQGADTFYVNLETGLDKTYIELRNVPVQLEMAEGDNTREENVASEKTVMDGTESEEDIAKNYEPISDWLEHPQRPGLKLRVLDAFACNTLEQHKEIKKEYFLETRIGSIIDDDIIFPAGEYPDTLTPGKNYYMKQLSDEIDKVLPEYTKLDSFFSEDEALTLKKKKELDALIEKKKEIIEQCMVYQPIFWIFQTVEIANDSKETYCFAEYCPNMHWRTIMVSDRLERQLRITSMTVDAIRIYIVPVFNSCRGNISCIPLAQWLIGGIVKIIP